MTDVPGTEFETHLEEEMGMSLMDLKQWDDASLAVPITPKMV